VGLVSSRVVGHWLVIPFGYIAHYAIRSINVHGHYTMHYEFIVE
jgi:hypothetical protein